MPQPALHLLLAARALERWRARPQPPFDVHDAGAVNAFLHGSLAPDMGNFPGGSRTLAQRVHTRRTADVQRALLRRATSPLQRAFALGWLTHLISDALIHPLVNDAVEQRADRRIPEMVEHVRVEVGIDVRFCWQLPVLYGLRLRPAFGRTAYAFLADTLNDVISADITAAQLARMERGLIVFSHGALHFATTVARQIWWRDAAPARVPLASTLLWHAATRCSPRNSTVNAYLTPHVPDAFLVRRVEAALRRFDVMLEESVADEARRLPNFDMADGTVMDADARGA